MCFVYDNARAPSAGDAIVQSISDLCGLLRHTTADVGGRLEPSTWSVLEYCCHIRDVLLVHREWVRHPARTLTRVMVRAAVCGRLALMRTC